MYTKSRPKKDPEAAQILARLKQEGIENLYHFAGVENLPGISKHQALLSKLLLDSNNEWPCPNPGGNDLSHSLDELNENWDRVALNLTSHTPMAYHKKSEIHLCFFVVSVEVAEWEGTVFTNTNAASDGHDRGEGLSGLALINFEMVRCIMPWSKDWIRLVQAEALIPHCIPMEFVSKVAFVSEASKKEGERLWGEADHPDFVVDREIFHNTPENLDSPWDFSFVSKVILTDSEVNRNNVRSIISPISRFQRKSTKAITAIIRLHALSGTRGKIKWSSGTEEEEEFEKSDEWYWWSKKSIEDLPNGTCSLEIRLNNILWTKADFEVVD